MKTPLMKNWKKYDHDNPKHRQTLIRNLMFMMALPDKFVPEKFDHENPSLKGTDLVVAKLFHEKREGLKKARIQAYATLNDFPATIKEEIEKFHEMAVYDNGYEEIFDVRDYSGSRKDGFSMSTIQSGLTFRRMLTGETLDVRQMSGQNEYVFFDYYGGALGWHRSLFDNQDWWGVQENASEFVNEAFRIRAATFYALIEAAAALLVPMAWQVGDDTLAVGTRGYTASRDVATINLACETILLALEAKGYGVSVGNANFKILSPLQLNGRMRQAVNQLYDINGNSKTLNYNVTLLTTTMLTVTNRFKVILPKIKFKAGYRMPLTQFTNFDLLGYADVVAGWMAFGGAVGDTDQMIECLTA